MAYEERWYQAELDHLVCEEWRHGARDVMPVLPCGGGKTVIFSNMMARERGACVLIAHRNHLVGQASMTLARQGVRHRVLGSTATQRTCVALHMAELGRHFVDPSAAAAVAGVDTLVKMDSRDPWFRQVGLVITDEGHHLLRNNKWGKARAMFPEARGAAFTATGMRPDGKGLGRSTDGLIDSMVEIIDMRDLINAGWLADYRISAADFGVDLSQVSIGPSGEMNHDQSAQAVHKARITGDVVEHYLKFSRGKLGATFAVDVKAAIEFTAAYRAAGVPAELITADTPEIMRASIFRRFKAREVLQLVNVDLLGEGTDVPNMEVISLARPTASWVTYVQQFCRPLRPFGDKVGVIHDHVGNVERFARTRGLPDTPQAYNLERRERTGKAKPVTADPVRTCLNPECLSVYERVLDCCPYCSTAHQPAGRGTIAQAEGVLEWVDLDVLRALRGEVDRVDGPAPNLASLGDIAARGAANKHRARQVAQAGLRAVMGVWAGWQTAQGRTDAETQRRFFSRYEMDSLSAAALGAREASELQARIQADLDAANVIAA